MECPLDQRKTFCSILTNEETVQVETDENGIVRRGSSWMLGFPLGAIRGWAETNRFHVHFRQYGFEATRDLFASDGV